MSSVVQPILHLTNGYPIHFDEIARVMHRAAAATGNSVIRLDDVAATLGVTDKKAKYVAAAGVALSVVEAKTFRLTAVGRCIYAADRFFDDIGTLWWMHYCLAGNPRHVVWSRIAGLPGLTCGQWTPQALCSNFHDLLERYAGKSLQNHVHREVSAVLSAYTESNLSRLAFVSKVGAEYTLGYREPMPPLVLAACIARFRDQHRPGDTALSVADILAAPNSPGLVCQIPEDRLRAGLEALKTQSGISLESRADLDQVRLTDHTPDYEWMERYYAGRR